MKSLLSLLLLCLTACSSISASTEADLVNTDYQVLLSSLLNIKSDSYTYIDSDGKKQFNSLKQFKELEHIYIKAIENVSSEKSADNKNIKVILFYAFYAKMHNSAAFLEYLATDLMPVYQGNKTAFLQSMDSLPFLIQPACNRLNAYFGFEGKHTHEKNSFLKANKPLFSQYLAESHYQICLNELN